MTRKIFCVCMCTIHRKQRLLFRTCLISLAVSDLMYVLVTSVVYLPRLFISQSALWVREMAMFIFTLCLSFINSRLKSFTVLFLLDSWFSSMCNTSIFTDISNFSQQYIACVHRNGSVHGCCENIKNSMGAWKVILSYMLCPYLGHGRRNFITNDINLRTHSYLCCALA
jgi:hypothetical protein